MLTLLDLKLPKLLAWNYCENSLQPLTRRLPVVVLTSSNEEQDLAAATIWASIATFASRSILTSSRKPSNSWVCIGWF